MLFTLHSFLYEWRDTAYFPVCPLPTVDRIDSIRTSPLLEFQSPRDQDFSWFLATLIVLADYYPKLKESSFLNESIYVMIAEDPRLTKNAEIIRQFECMTAAHFRLAFMLCQHLYARAKRDDMNSRGGAKTIVKRGMCVLYHYVYCFIGRNSERTIINQIKQLRDVQIKNVDMSDDNHRWCIENFRREESTFVSEPTAIIYIPWIQFLSAVGRKCGSCPLVNGKACVIYTQAARWISERWKCVVKLWKEHDYAILEPWFDHQYKIHEHTIKKKAEELGRRSSQFNIWKTSFYAEQFYNRAHTLLMGGSFFDRRQFVDCGIDPVTALQPLYVKVFALGRQIESRGEEERRSRGDKMALELRNDAETGDFFVDYGPIMPPCIRHLYEKTIRARSHFKYDDRQTFFSWAFTAGIPLSSVNAMWVKMCGEDKNVSPRDVSALLATPGQLYQLYTTNRQTGKVYNFKGCAKMAQHCIFVDIEEITQRKSMCVQSTCIPIEGKNPPAPEKWSPMLATIIQYRQHKLHSDLVGDIAGQAAPAHGQ